MTKRTSVVNISGDYEESLLQFARHLGQSQIRRQLFDAIYGRGTRPRSKKQIMHAANIDKSKSQQVQNQLEHLSKHHLIVKILNEGIVSDGSQYVYGKDETVRANRERIVRLADNRKLAERTATKRRPILSSVVKSAVVTKKTLKRRKKLVVLYLTASPDTSNPLRVDLEVKKVQEAIRGSPYRDNIQVEYRPAANLDAIIDGLNDHRPQIVHFSGHSDVAGICADDGSISKPGGQDVSFELLAKALSATDSPAQVVVLNSCESSRAKGLVLASTKILISMRSEISDIAAIAFATRFYAAIASGQSVKSAFDQGVAAIMAASISEFDTPELVPDSSADPSALVLT